MNDTLAAGPHATARLQAPHSRNASPAPAIPLIDNLSTAIVVLDEHLSIVLLNQSAETLFGNSLRHLQAQPIERVLNLPESLAVRLHEALESEKAFNDRQAHIAPAGREQIVVDITISPWREHPQDPAGLLLELNPLDRSLRIARDAALYSQQELVHQLLRGLAHEIKNPLGGLRGAAQLLQRELQREPELTEYTDIIIREADRLQALIDRLFGPVTRPQHTLLNVHEPLEHVRRIVEVAATPNISIQCDYDPSIPEFMSDRDRLVQVFLNIAGNAIEALRRDSSINPAQLTFRSRVSSNMTLAGTRHPLVASIAFIDNGPGIDAALREQVFYPLVSGRAEGTGLGLSISQSIMNQLGGLIECRSEPGHTAFTVHIPMSSTETAQA